MIKGLTVTPIDSYSTFQSAYSEALKKRKVGATDSNSQSSRSHLIFTLYLGNAKLSIIDLAGSERASETNARGERLKEGCLINKSLSTLSDVISSLAKGASYVRFRDSKLTYFLKDCLAGGNTQTLIISCISLHPDCLEESIRTLDFAAKAMNIKLKRLPDQIPTSQKGDSHLEVENAALKARIADLELILCMQPVAYQECLNGSQSTLKEANERLNRYLQQYHGI